MDIQNGKLKKEEEQMDDRGVKPSVHYTHSIVINGSNKGKKYITKNILR